MTAECGERLRHGLFVADVGIDVPQDGQPGPDVGRNVQTGLMHQAQEAESPQGDRLPTRVRSRDEQGRELAAEPDVDRNDLAGETGMASAEEHDLRPTRDLRRNGIHLLGQACLRRPEVEPGERIQGLSQWSGLSCHHGR